MTGLSGAAIGIYVKLFAGIITPYHNTFFFLLFGTMYSGLFMNVDLFDHHSVVPGWKDMIALTVAGMCTALY